MTPQPTRMADSMRASGHGDGDGDNLRGGKQIYIYIYLFYIMVECKPCLASKHRYLHSVFYKKIMLQTLVAFTKDKRRDAVSNWPAYILSRLRRYQDTDFGGWEEGCIISTINYVMIIYVDRL